MKSKNTILSKLLLFFILSITLTSCHTSFDFGGEKGNGNVITQTRAITEIFEKIEVNSGLDVVVSQADIASVTVKIDENIQPLITTKVINGVLIVNVSDSYSTKSNPEIHVKLPFISGLTSTSGSTIIGGTVLKSTSLAVKSTSGSEIEIEVEADFISLESTSGSDIEVSGKALKVETSSTSGSDIDAGKLIANEVNAQATSGSSTKINPVLLLKGKATSGADIKYKNIPKKVEKVENSGGSIKQY